MATTIKLKNGSGAPLAGDLVQGEPALDLTNKRLYTEDSGGTVIEVGTNPGTDVTFADNRKAIFGSGSDLEIYHNGSDSFINETGTGDLKVQAAGQIKLGSPTGEFYATFNENSDVVLWYDNAAKLATTSTGIDVTGTSLADTLETSTGSGGLINIIRDDPTVGTNNSLGAIYWKSTEDSGTTVNIGAGILALADQNHSTTASGSRLVFQTTAISSTSPTERMVIDSSGNVGIGTTSPSNILHISSSDPTIRLQDTDATGYCLINAASNSRIQIKADEGNNDANTTIEFHVDGTERMRIDSSGNVNIYGTDDRPLAITSFDTVSNGAGWDLNATSSNGVVTMSTSGTERMRIDSSGNVGIGTTSPGGSTGSRELTINGSISAQTSHQSGTAECNIGTNGSTNFVQGVGAFPLEFSTNATERMRIDSSGNLLVGTTSNDPNSRGFNVRTSISTVFGVAGIGVNAHQTLLTTCASFSNANGQVGSITTNGSVTAYNTSSDQRLKENIVDAPAGNIDAIRVRSFDWKVDGSHQTYGMVAQELVDVAPEAVSQGQTEDDMWGVDYSKLVPMMIKEIQDLKAEVAALKGA